MATDPTFPRSLYHSLETLQFRLVRVQQGSRWSNRVQVEIQHHKLDPIPPYTAISYAWGDADDTRKLQIVGSTAHGTQELIGVINVTVSLYEALQAVQQHTPETLVWIDGLCIDQHNDIEKSEQIRFMPFIYSNAESVAIWLGPETSDSQIALDALEHLSLPPTRT